MRRTLLDKLNTLKMRQALVLITLFLLPCAAWGEANSVTYTFGSPDLDNNTVVSTTGQATSTSWNIKNLKISNNSYSLNKSESTLGFSVSGSNSAQTATISFDLISDFGITGTVTRIDIEYNTGSKISSGTFSAGKDLENITESLFDNKALETSTSDKTLSFSIPQVNNYHQFFKNDKIRLAVSFNADLSDVNNVYFNIKSITIHTNTISVGGYCPDETGAIIGGNITSYSGKDGEVSAVGYDATNNILTLENVKIQGYLYYSEDADLTIKLIGDNAFWAENNSDGDVLTLVQCTGSHNLTIQKQSDATNASLKLFSGFSSQDSTPNWDDINLISGFSNTNTELTVLESTSGSNLPGYNQRGKLVAYTTLSLKVAGNSPTTNGTISGSGIEGSVLFDVSSNELTLDNTTISGPIEWNNGTNDLTINLKGKNSIIIDKGESAPVSVFQSESACSLKVEKLGTESATLKYASYGTIDGKTSDVASYFDNFILSTNTAFKLAASVIDNIQYNYITTEDTYDISVAGIQVHGIEGELGYKNNILNNTGESIVIFNGSNNTLTLKNATINGPIKSGIGALKVHLSGSSTMSGISSDNKPFQYNGALDTKTLSFETTDAEAGELTMNGIHVDGTFSNAITNYYTINQTFTNSSTVSDDWVYFSYYDSSEPAQQKIVINKNIDYHLSIGGQPVGKSNASTIFGSTMSFTPADATAETHATLTLTGATITNGGVVWSGSDNLTIALNGKNSIINNEGDAISCVWETYPPTLTFAKAEGANSCLLTLKHGNDSHFIYDFGNETYVTTGSGLYYIEGATAATVTSSILSGGSGTSADPFLIKTEQDLKDLATYVNRNIVSNEIFSLENDIICSESASVEFEPIGYWGTAPGSGTPVDNTFKGTFKGNGKTISGLKIGSSLSYVALFGAIEGGSVENLNLKNCTITGGSYTAAIVGQLGENGKIDHCTVSGSSVSSSESSGEPHVGGIAGEVVRGTVTYCQISSSTITASTGNGDAVSLYSGGIVGLNEGGDINNCEVKGDNTTITSNCTNSAINPYIYAGAVIGSNNYENLAANTYESSVSVNAAGTIYSGQTQRGIGNSDGSLYDMIEDNQVILSGVRNIKTDCFVEQMEGVSSFYGYISNYDQETETSTYTIKSLPGENTVICVMQEDNAEATYTIKNPSTNTIIESTVEKVSSDVSGPSFIKISFIMPDADLDLSARTAAPAPSMTENQTYACFYSDDKDYDVPANMTAYIITDVKDGKVLVSAVSYIKKGVAVLLEKGKTTEVENTTDFSANKLIYAKSPVTADNSKSIYVLYNNKFTKVTNGTSVKEKCYLDLSSLKSSGTRSYYDIDGSDGTTALREVRSEGVKGEKWGDGEWFTLQGRCLSAKPTNPGLYLHNGKKVVIK